MIRKSVFNLKASYKQAKLLSRRVVAYDPTQATLTPKAFWEIFGIVITDDKRVRVIENVYGHDHEQGQREDYK